MSEKAGRAPGRSQAGPHPLGGSADVLVGRGAPVTPIHEYPDTTWADDGRLASTSASAPTSSTDAEKRSPSSSVDVIKLRPASFTSIVRFA